MKILEEKYPLGSLPNQKTAGRYIDEMYYENLKILAEVIKDDMTFMAIISSSTLEVGTGKSVFVQQTAEAWVHLVNKIHNLNLPDINMRNIVFRPEDLIKRAFEIPQYSVIIVDEWEDAHYWSKLGVSLRQFFRKCRQLNLFIILIIPNFFQMPMNYAISRSVFFVDVRFEGKFERGYFRFFSFAKKKDLYMYGKKTQNYDCVKPDFIGRFTKGYAVNEDTYRIAKHNDMVLNEKNVPDEKKIRMNLFAKLREHLNVSMRELLEVFDISESTGYDWIEKVKLENELQKSLISSQE
jgi:hypothetical protein